MVIKLTLPTTKVGGFSGASARHARQLCPSCLIFRAALRSRSMVRPQKGQE